MVVVDASVWIDYLRGLPTAQTIWLDESLATRRLGLTDITLCEVLQGVTDPAQVPQVRDRLLAFEILATGGTELALAASANYRRLRERGITVRKTIDCWVASYCLLQGYTLLHNDRDFLPFERHLGLQAIAPA